MDGGADVRVYVCAVVREGSVCSSNSTLYTTLEYPKERQGGKKTNDLQKQQLLPPNLHHPPPHPSQLHIPLLHLLLHQRARLRARLSKAVPGLLPHDPNGLLDQAVQPGVQSPCRVRRGGWWEWRFDDGGRVCAADGVGVGE